MKNKFERLNVLLIDDSEADYFLIKTSLEDVEKDVSLDYISDPTRVIKHLDQLHSSNESLFPDIILLDIRMPKLNGLELLKRLRSNKKYATIVVIMLSSSAHLSDVNQAYQLNANTYFQKPFDYESYKKLIQNTVNYWEEAVFA